MNAMLPHTFNAMKQAKPMAIICVIHHLECWLEKLMDRKLHHSNLTFDIYSTAPWGYLLTLPKTARLFWHSVFLNLILPRVSLPQNHTQNIFWESVRKVHTASGALWGCIFYSTTLTWWEFGGIYGGNRLNCGLWHFIIRHRELLYTMWWEKEYDSQETNKIAGPVLLNESEPFI